LEDEYLTSVVVNPLSKSFLLISNMGEEKIVDCDSINQFMNVLEVVRNLVDEEDVAYVDPLTKIDL
jgi:hypothetical protein